ncbi:MAG: FAD:protein FMN transferase [Clostridia bacterium]|nr:FAD:protein FMN transferase [Clostridia bacterium]
MKKFSSILIALVLIFSSCTAKITDIGTPVAESKAMEKFSAYYFDYFDTATTIVGYAESKEDFDSACERITAQLKEYHRLYNIYNRYDGIINMHTVNHSSGAITVDERIIDMLLFAKEAYSLTSGRTNIAMGRVLSLWHSERTHGEKHPESAKLPDMEKLKEASLYTNIENLVIDSENNTVTLLDGIKLDVGAVAKGYAVEMIAKSLEKEGISGYLLNVGGNVRAVGARPDGTKWSVGIENPNKTGEDDAFLAIVAAENEAVVTSGSYQRYYYVNGKAYHHIIDPDTLMPGENFRSVSIVCGDSGLGDALSTALFCMSYEEGAKLINSLDGVEAMWVLPNGNIEHSQGFEQYLK